MSIPATQLARIIDALAFAAHAHREQRRKDADKTPYINHPVALVHILSVEAGIEDSDILCAAALHDYLEDCCGGIGQPTLEEGRQILNSRFGSHVLLYVNAVTDDKELSKDERKRLQAEHAAHAPLGAKMVKLADKIANLRDLASSPPADWPLSRRQEYFEWAALVISGVRGSNETLEALFDDAHSKRPQ